MNMPSMTRVSVAVALLAIGTSAFAYEGELKRGRLYFRQICTSCHQEMIGKAIAPNERLKAAGAILSVIAASASAYDADWKRGRVYYRSVCTSCHAVAPIGSINPSTKTKAEWAAYIKADKHDKTGKSHPSVKYFTTKAYRETIKGKNKAAEKLLNANDADLYTDVQAWLQYSAKDSDNPSGCN